MGDHRTRARLILVCLAALLITLLALAGGAAASPGTATTVGSAPMAADAGFGWIVQLRGAARSEDMTYKQLHALAVKYPATWTDDNGTPGDLTDDTVYTGVPLWHLIGLIDDTTPSSFNDALAAKDYAIQVVALDGFTATFTSTQIARKDDIIVADWANGQPLTPLGTVKAGTPGPPPTPPSWKPNWPIKLVSANLTGKQKPAGIARIIVYKPGVTPPTTPSTAPYGWIVQLRGAARNEDMTYKTARALAVAHPASWTDDNKTPDDPSDDHVYTGVPLWRIIARIDDGTPTTFNDNLAGMDYGLHVIAVDGFTADFTATQVAHRNDIVFADRMDGAQIPTVPTITDNGDGTYSWKPSWPAKLVSANLTGKQKPGGILRITLDKPVYPAYKTSLTLRGKLIRTIPYAKFPNGVRWDGTKAGDINPTLKGVYRGQSLYKLVGMVDDRYPKTFNKALALKGYKIQFIARDGYKVTISSKTIVGRSGWIVACLKDGKMLSADEGPYRYVGSFIKPFFGKLSAAQVVTIKLIF
jgi:hypothetical protein